MKKNFLLLAALLGFLGALAAPARAVNAVYYFNAPPLQGDSIAKGHEHEITALGYQFAAAADGSNTFVLEKGLDKASTDLLAAMRDGTSYPTGTLTVVHSNVNPILTIQFTDLLVVTVEAGNSNVGDLPTEKVTFSFSTAVITYFEMSAKGTRIQHQVTLGTPPAS